MLETFRYCDLPTNRPENTGRRRIRVGPGESPLVPPAGFRVLPRRWVVERTFAWLGRNRRLSKDDKGLPATKEARIYIGMARVLAVRLVR